ncbi:Manganese transport system membrane protein mntB [Morganella morganii]|nr:Manganese transport system membrane protein mntB [Morganella morganii]
MSDFLTSLFIDPFAFPFMQRAMFAAILTGAVCAVLSCFLVLKGWSLMGMQFPMRYCRVLCWPS